ncbi:hypothetical protein [Aeoliella sp. SH292]|uniref:hypothetical protein n=1 Tax=Aeoliella sp. SH292 TaxID=3454464 RepID=UPI003F969F91
MATLIPIDIILRSQVIDHMVAALKATKAEEHPFPHFLTIGFFPDAVYDDLQECLPEVYEYHPFAYEKHSNDTGESNRRRFQLVNKKLDTLPDMKRRFWYTVRSCLGSTAVKEAVFEKLRHGLAYRYGSDATRSRDLPGFALPELFHETQGYRIAPHPDTRKKVVTMQIALPEDESCRDMGTEFYRRTLRPDAWVREPKGFDIVKTMPFLPNTAYAFVVLNTIRLKSWHGRSTLAGQAGVRNSLLNIWYQQAAHGNTEVLAENQWLEQQRLAA